MEKIKATLKEKIFYAFGNMGVIYSGLLLEHMSLFM